MIKRKGEKMNLKRIGAGLITLLQQHNAFIKQSQTAGNKRFRHFGKQSASSPAAPKKFGCATAVQIGGAHPRALS